MGRRYISDPSPPSSYRGGIPLSKTDDRGALPKSIRHKRILDLAAEQPAASLEELAAGIPSATTDLVEHVLEEYGDPADDTTTDGRDDANEPTATESSSDLSVDDGDGDDEGGDVDETEADGEAGADDTTTGASSYPDVGSLTGKQRRTLEAIRARPQATQQELAADLDVTAPTICNRVNSLPGFEWSQRESFAAAVLDAETGSAEDTESTSTDTDTTPMGTETTTADADAAPPDDRQHLTERLDALEAKLDDGGPGSDRPPVFVDPELLHKVVHACMESSVITEDEELRILEALLPGSAGGCPDN